MHYYKFIIKLNDKMIIKTHYAGFEETGLLWCERFIKDLKDEFDLSKIKVCIFERPRINDDHYIGRGLGIAESRYLARMMNRKIPFEFQREIPYDNKKVA